MPAIQARDNEGLAMLVVGVRSTERHLGGRFAKIWCIPLEVREKKGSGMSSWTDGEH